MTSSVRQIGHICGWGSARARRSKSLIRRSSRFSSLRFFSLRARSRLALSLRPQLLALRLFTPAPYVSPCPLPHTLYLSQKSSTKRHKSVSIAGLPHRRKMCSTSTNTYTDRLDAVPPYLSSQGRIASRHHTSWHSGRRGHTCCSGALPLVGWRPREAGRSLEGSEVALLLGGRPLGLGSTAGICRSLRVEICAGDTQHRPKSNEYCCTQEAVRSIGASTSGAKSVALALWAAQAM